MVTMVMIDYTQFRKHLETLKKTVYTEPQYSYHEKMTDSVFKQLIEPSSFKDVLDVGFGTGYALDKFKTLGIKTTGITLDEEERKAANFLHDVRLMDMAFLEFEDESFDLVWCRHAIEHSPMPMIVLMEFKRVLRKGGHLYIEVPSSNSIHIENANHYSMLNDEAWQSLFRKVGLQLIFRGQMCAMIGSDRGVSADIYWQYWLLKDGE